MDKWWLDDEWRVTSTHDAAWPMTQRLLLARDAIAAGTVPAAWAAVGDMSDDGLVLAVSRAGFSALVDRFDVVHGGGDDDADEPGAPPRPKLPQSVRAAPFLDATKRSRGGARSPLPDGALTAAANVEVWAHGMPYDDLSGICTALGLPYVSPHDVARATFAVGLVALLGPAPAAAAADTLDEAAEAAQRTDTAQGLDAALRVAMSFSAAGARRKPVATLLFPCVGSDPVDVLVALLFPSAEQRAFVDLCTQGYPSYDDTPAGRQLCIAERAAVFHSDLLFRSMPLPAHSALYAAVHELHLAMSNVGQVYRQGG